MTPQELLLIMIPLAILQLALMITALIDVVRREPERVRGPKWAWMLGIVLVSLFGPVAYFLAGRKD